MVVACHASAPNMARPLWCHISLFSLKHLDCYMVLTFFTSDLLDLIIIEISSDNYQHKETSLREVEQTGSSHEPAGQGSFIATQPPLRARRESPDRPRDIRSASKTAPDLTSKRQICISRTQIQATRVSLRDRDEHNRIIAASNLRIKNHTGVSHKSW